MNCCLSNFNSTTDLSLWIFFFENFYPVGYCNFILQRAAFSSFFQTPFSLWFYYITFLEFTQSILHGLFRYPCPEYILSSFHIDAEYRVHTFADDTIILAELNTMPSKNTTGYIFSSGRFCHSFTSGSILSVILEIIPCDTSVPYISRSVSSISRCDIPLAYIAMIFCSISSVRVCLFSITLGSNSPLRSRNSYLTLAVFAAYCLFTVTVTTVT